MATKQQRKIDRIHALFGIYIGHTCGECCNFVSGQYRTKILRKCMVYGLTHSEASDWRKCWTACKMFDHEYSGRPVIDLMRTKKDPDEPMKGQIDFWGGG